MIARVRPWVPVILWAAAIFAVSAQPRLPVPLQSNTDKIAHFATYAVLGALLARAQLASGTRTGVVGAMGLLYAASDEIHQSYVPGRSADPADWVADALGVAAGLFLYRRAYRRRAAARPGLPTSETIRSAHE